jgi:hypothetical protein
MKNITLLFVLFLSSFTFAGNFECTPQNPIEWKELAEGVMWTKYDLSFSPYNKENRDWEPSKSRSVTVRAFKIDVSKNKLLFHRSSKDLDCNPEKNRYIHQLVKDSGAQIIGAINASFFVMPNGKIEGIAIDENKMWSNDLSSQTISSSGVLSIENGETTLQSKEDFISRFGAIVTQEDAQKLSFAVQAYPKLLINNLLQIGDGVLNSKRSRTSIGVSGVPNEILLVTIDARGETDKTGMTLYEYAHFLNKTDCGVAQSTALNLDGGGSSSFAIPSLNIYEQADRCRHLGNILTIQSRI